MTTILTSSSLQFQEGKQVDPNMYGIIQRSLRYLFTQLNQQRGSKIVRASYLEIYNEQVSTVIQWKPRGSECGKVLSASLFNST